MTLQHALVVPMVNAASPNFQQRLNKCRRSPSSKTCRKYVYYAKNVKVRDDDGSLHEPRNGSMTRAKLTRNTRGQIVSKKKSQQGKKAYYTRESGLRQWNEAAKNYMGRGRSFDPHWYDLDPPYSDDYQSNGGEVPYDDAPYVPFDASTPPRRSVRTKRPLKSGDYRYHGTGR